jgi:hypothetical protein
MERKQNHFGDLVHSALENFDGTSFWDSSAVALRRQASAAFRTRRRSGFRRLVLHRPSQ